MKSSIFLTLSVFLGVLHLSMSAHAQTAASKGVGPIPELKLSATLDEGLARKGQEAFNAKCSACHKMEERFVGPALKDVFKRRTPEWIANMILNPIEMTQKDAAAQDLLADFLVQMTFQDVSKEQAQYIVEYFRFYSEKGELSESKATVKSKKAKPKT